jgi:hypothetical protein
METRPVPSKRFYCYPATNEVEGPFELMELAGLLRENLISGETQTLREGEETWLPFQDRPEFNFAKEIPNEAIAQLRKEKADNKVSDFHPRKLLTFVWVLLPVFLYVLYRLLRFYISYHLAHDDSSTPDDPSHP